MAALEDALTAGARAVDYLGDWFDRAGLCCSMDPEARDRLLTFEVQRGAKSVRVAASQETLAAALGREGLVHEVAARIARTADAELSGKPAR
jgi:hypothetical protein